MCVIVPPSRCFTVARCSFIMQKIYASKTTFAIALTKYPKTAYCKRMMRGLIRDTKTFPASRQEKILADAGVKAIYRDDFEGCLKSLRKGDTMAVSGLRALAGNRRGIVARLDEVHDKGNAVIDAATLRRSDGRHGPNLMAEAIADLANEKRGPGDSAAENGSKGGKKSARSKRQGRMPKTTASAYWLDRSLTNTQALERMNADPNYPREWTVVTAYRNLGRRGALAGRRANKS